MTIAQLIQHCYDVITPMGAAPPPTPPLEATVSQQPQAQTGLSVCLPACRLSLYFSLDFQLRLTGLCLDSPGIASAHSQPKTHSSVVVGEVVSCAPL